MGQPITVIEKPSSNPALLRLETNRPLSGMGHERYSEPPSELLERPVDELARRLFATGEVEYVHINGSVVTVTLLGGRTGEGLADVVRHLFRHYGDDAVAPAAAATPPTDEADTTPEALADPAEAPAAEAAEEPAAAEPVAAEDPAPAEPAAAEPVAAEDPAPADG